MVAAQADCALCASSDSAPRVVGGNEHWRLNVHPGYELPGWYFFQTTDHVAELDEASPAVVATMGPCLSEAMAAIRSVARVDKVYLFRFGETFAHFHFVLCARPDSVPVESRGARYFLDREHVRDDVASAALADQLERYLADCGRHLVPSMNGES